MESQVSLTLQPPTYIDLNQLYTSYGFKHIIRRHCEYVRENPYGNLIGRALPLTLITAGGIAGFAAGTHAANILKVEKEKKIVLQGGGTILGGIAGGFVYLGVTESELFFKTWKFLKITHTTLEFVFKNHEKDEFLNQFLDCVHYTPLVVPVRLSTGHLIDLDTIKNIKPNENGEILCPHTRETLDLKNLKIDLELYTIILKRFQYLLQQDLTNFHPDSDDYKATELQLDVIEKNISSIYEKHLKGLEQLRLVGKITLIEYTNLVAQFVNHFGINPTGKGDLENEIEPHTMDFSLNWKDIIKKHSKIVFKGTPETQFIEDI